MTTISLILALIPATLTGNILLPESTMGWSPSLTGFTVRTEGTTLAADVDPATGGFTLTGLPAGKVVVLVEEPGTDVFTADSRRREFELVPGENGPWTIDLGYHWREIAGYPEPWGAPGYGEWTAQFVSADVGFVMFRVRADGTHPERIELWRTRDGGASWVEAGVWEAEDGPVPFPSLDRVFHFSDADHGVVLATLPCVPCGGCGVGFFVTADGGASWGLAALPVPVGSYALTVAAFAQIDAARVIALGSSGCSAQGYGGKFYDVVWESTDAGASWVTAWSLEEFLGGTAVGALPDGRAVAFLTPYWNFGVGGRLVRDAAGAWTAQPESGLGVNSGYGPADVAAGGGAMFVAAGQGSLPHGLYRSDDGGATWGYVSAAQPAVLAFADARKGFAAAGAPYVTYDGGVTWLAQGAGGGICCHGNSIWAFDAMHAVWVEGGYGDPNGRSQLFVYHEPAVADFEVTAGRALPDAHFERGDEAVPLATLALTSHGPVPVEVRALTVRAAGMGDAAGSVARVRLWRDRDGDGRAGAGDVELARGTFAAGDAALRLALDEPLTLTQQVPVQVLVTYDFGADVCPGAAFAATVAAAEVEAVRGDTLAPLAASAPAGVAIAGRTVREATAVLHDSFDGGAFELWTVVSGDPSPDAGYGWIVREGPAVSAPYAASIIEDRGHEGWETASSLVLAAPLGLVAPGAYWMEYAQRYELDASVKLFVEGSTDGGGTWVELASFGSVATWAAVDTGGVFEQRVVDLAALAGHAALLRFRFDWTSGWYFYGRWWIDEVRVFREAPRVPVVAVTPSDGIAFGEVRAGVVSDVTTVDVENLASATLVCDAVALSGAGAAEFRVVSDDVSGRAVGACAAASVGVAFAPAGLGARAATLSVVSNDPAAPLVTIALSGTGTFDVAPAVGTVSTVLTLTGRGFGTARGKVTVGSAACTVSAWSDASVRCTLSKALAPGVYGVSLLKAGKGATWFARAGAFAVRAPVVSTVSPPVGGPRTSLNVGAEFLGTKSGASVKLIGPAGGRVKTYGCALKAWSADNASGHVAITCTVPGAIPAGMYTVRVANRGMSAQMAGGFTVQ